MSLQNPEQTQYKTNVQNSQQIILGSKTVWKKKKYAPEKLKSCEYCNFFFFFVSAPKKTTVQNEQLRIREAAKSPNRFSKTGKGEIEGTIMLLSSREREIKMHTDNKTYSKLSFLLYIYSVTPKGGKREGGKLSSVPVLRSSWQGKT